MLFLLIDSSSIIQQPKCTGAYLNITMGPWQLQAHIPASNTPIGLLNNSTSHHATSNLSNISLHAPYTSFNNIMIGDWIDSTAVRMLNTIFVLYNVLWIPSMETKLVSIFQLCTSSNVSIELTIYFSCEAIRTMAVPLNGQIKDGLHKWQIPSPLPAFSSVKTTSCDWRIHFLF